MSFCRITGRSRGLPKPNYFPLLPPISPADAKRFCRITGKSYGLPSHHYTPVILVKSTKIKSTKCQTTIKSHDRQDHHNEPESESEDFTSGSRRRHVLLSEYRYVFPVLDSTSEQQKTLIEILAGKNCVETPAERFVYTVEEQRCNLVLSAQLEAAVRDGDVKDVMLAKDCDTMLLKLRQGRNVTIDVQDVVIGEVKLWEGEGPSEAVLKEIEKDEKANRKRKKKRTEGLSSMKKIFEEKERIADIEEQKVSEILEKKKLKVVEVKISSKTLLENNENNKPESNVTNNVVDKNEGDELRDWKCFNPDHNRTETSLYVTTGDWRDLIKPLIDCRDWNTLQKESATCSGVPVTATIPSPIIVQPETVDLGLSLPGIVQEHSLGTSSEIGGFEPVPAVAPFKPLIAEPNIEVQKAIKSLSEEALLKTVFVKQVFEEETNGNIMESLPGIEEIAEIVANLDKGVKTKVGAKDGPKVEGLALDIAAAQRFVPGQSVETPQGFVFVPGQTLQTPSGPVFIPGFTVRTPEGPVLIPGQQIIVEEDDGQRIPVFIAGQTLSTREGERFVAGQTMHTPEGSKFVAGQTVFTPDGPKFIAGQVVAQEGITPRFVPGQTVMTTKGPEFVPGQTIATPHGEAVFIPGQSIHMETDWEFIPGQSVKTDDGQAKFVPGQTLMIEESPQFIPGQTVRGNVGEPPQFVPGVVIEDETGHSRFVPGKTVQTPQGPQFLEGQILKTAIGTMFVPGKTEFYEDKLTVLKFAVAKHLQDVIVPGDFPDVLPVDPTSVNVVTTPQKKKKSVFGHMLQTSHGVQFFPGNATGLPVGKVVPGELIHGEEGEINFVPGIIAEDGSFVPGQVVMTEKGEQFVPGQVVETQDGPKFVPGQVVVTRTGPKFVPGQTIDAEEGPRFVPGQIVETKAGPTFIPGQVISTEDEGSRFVPGQVVDTADGPRFVPGRVIETGDHVTFVPGQVVQTQEGLHFVAPDLQDTPQGGFEFSVQGFEVTPEELKLLQPRSRTVPCFTSRGEMTIDSRMLRQLSEAGMSVGRQVPADLPGVNVNTTLTQPAMEVAKELTEKLGLNVTSSLKMGEVMATVARLGNEVIEHVKQKITNSFTMRISSVPESENTLRGLAEAVINAVVVAASQQKTCSEESVMCVIGAVFESVLKDVHELQPSLENHAVEALVDSLHSFFLAPDNMCTICDKVISEISRSYKVNILKDVLHEDSEDIIVEKLTQVLQDNQDLSGKEDPMGAAFKHMTRGHPELVGRVLKKVSETVGNLKTERGAMTALQRAIVAAVRETSERRLMQMLVEPEMDQELRVLLLQSIGLARALGMSETASGLLAVISDPESRQALSQDQMTMDILRRLTVMRQLAEERPNLTLALGQLQSDPELARSDPRLRELVRESAALMVVPEEPLPLQSSADIPNVLFHSENILAMEEYLFTKTGRRMETLLILKQGLQAVVPREASRAVLTGQIPYSVLDEKGLRHFEPLHVFSALRLPRPSTHRFSMYCCPVEEEPYTTTMNGTITPGSGSMEDLPPDNRRHSDASNSTQASSMYKRRSVDLSQNPPIGSYASDLDSPDSKRSSYRSFDLSQNTPICSYTRGRNSPIYNRSDNRSFDLSRKTPIGSYISGRDSPIYQRSDNLSFDLSRKTPISSYDSELDSPNGKRSSYCSFDMSQKTPIGSYTRGRNSPIYNRSDNRSFDLSRKTPIGKYTSELDSPDGKRSSYRRLDLSRKTPKSSYTSGLDNPIYKRTDYPCLDLSRKTPTSSYTSGLDNPIYKRTDYPSLDLSHKTPTGSYTSGLDNPIYKRTDYPSLDLSHKTPTGSYTSGLDNPSKRNNYWSSWENTPSLRNRRINSYGSSLCGNEISPGRTTIPEVRKFHYVTLFDRLSMV